MGAFDFSTRIEVVPSTWDLRANTGFRYRWTLPPPPAQEMKQQTNNPPSLNLNLLNPLVMAQLHAIVNTEGTVTMCVDYQFAEFKLMLSGELAHGQPGPNNSKWGYGLEMRI